MYIIAKNKDYYDGVVGTVGMDKTIVYERETIEITDNNKMPKIFQHRKYSWDNKSPFLGVCRATVDHNETSHKYNDARGFIVGFCGKLYLGWKFYYEVEEFSVLGVKEEVTKTDIIYGYENAKEFLKADYWRSNLDDDVKYVMNYDPINIFREVRSPIFVYDTYRKDDAFIINPMLKDYEFYKAVDAFTAFTELQMYISGVLGTGEKEIIEISNENKIEQHGFDRKWSFRKEPSKKI